MGLVTGVSSFKIELQHFVEEVGKGKEERKRKEKHFFIISH